jgi:hypothetical protein
VETNALTRPVALLGAIITNSPTQTGMGFAASAPELRERRITIKSKVYFLVNLLGPFCHISAVSANLIS